MRRASLAVAVTLTMAAWAARARADAPVELTWEGACDRTSDVVKAVGRVVGSTDRPPVRARVHVTPSARGYSVELRTELEGDTGVRRFEAPTCEKLADATVLILVVLLAPVDASNAIGAPLASEKGPTQPPIA